MTKMFFLSKANFSKLRELITNISYLQNSHNCGKDSIFLTGNYLSKVNIENNRKYEIRSKLMAKTPAIILHYCQ